MSTISQLRGAIRSGLTRTNRWRVVVNLPSYAGSNSDGQQAALLARTTATPSSTVGTIEVSWGGRNLPVPGDRTYEDFQVTFIGVNDMKVYNAFQKWSEAMNGSESNSGLTNLDEIMSDITLQLLDVNDVVTKTFVLIDAWPSVVGQMSMDAGAMDAFAEFDVNFKYTSYTQPNITR